MNDGPVAVTGSTGFVGRHLVALLREQGREVVAISRRQRPSSINVDHGVRWVTADLRDAMALAAAFRDTRPAALVHLAAFPFPGRSVHDPLVAMDSITLGTTSVLEGLRAANVPARVLLIGSAEEYGIVPDAEQPIVETRVPHPPTPYALAKRHATELGLLYHHNFDMDVIGVRAFNHTGPGQQPGFVCPEMALQVLAAERAGGGKISVGNPEIVRDFSDVRDVVEAYSLLCDKGVGGEIYNVASGVGRRIGDIVDTLRACVETPTEMVVDGSKARPQAWDSPKLIGDASKLRAATGWEPKIPFEQSLSELLESLRGRLGP